MRKSILLACIGLILASCSTEKNNYPDEPKGESNSFLSVSLVTAKTNVRADDDDYEDGTPQENNVNTIRFYFFDSEGNAAPVFKESVNGTYLSYIDWQPLAGDESTGGVPGQTVEKIVNATLGINIPEQAELPSLVLAVINPTSSLLTLQGNPSLTTLRSIVADYYTGLTSNNFVICNSVYAENGSTIDATVIDSDCYGSTAEEAEQNPLIIYVERVLARLDLSINIEGGEELDGGYIYPANDKPYSLEGQEQEVYIKFLGWNVTSTPNASRLIKNINPEWPDDLFGNLEIWNSNNYHRSFWAVNPPTDQFDYLYGAYEGTPNSETENFMPASQYEIPAPNTTVKTYIQENAAEYTQSENGTGSSINASKVIISAQLVNKNGQPISIARWANRYYSSTGVVNAIINSLNLYKVSTVDGQTSYTKINPIDLQFLSAKELYGEELPDDVKSYYTYVQLTEDAEKLTWALGNDPNSPVFTDK